MPIPMSTPMPTPMPSDQEILAAAIRVINVAFIGLFTTVDEAGNPHSRYMGGATYADGLQKIYTLTGRQTRKLEHLQQHPEVCWVFALADYVEIVTLRGKALVIADAVVSGQLWDRLADCARNYAMNVISNQQSIELVTIQTQVETVEYLCPAKGLVAPKAISLSCV